MVRGMVRRVSDPGNDAEALAATEHEVLALRLRVEELEQRLAQARQEQEAVRGLTQSRLGRAVKKGRRIARSRRQDVVVAAAGGHVAPGVTRIPLVGMPSDGSTRCSDEVMIGGVPLPGILADAPTALVYRVIPQGPVRFRAFAGVRTGDRRGNRGGVRFVAAVVAPDGREIRRAELLVDPVTTHRHRHWLPVELDLGGLADAPYELVLTTELPDGASADCAWSTWGDPVLLAGTAEKAPKALLSRARVALRRNADTVGGPGPLVSFLVPVHDPAPELLGRTIASVFAQTSPHWQLCLSDDGSTDVAVRDIIDGAAKDPRVVVARSGTAAGISAATNAALALATGEYVAPLDHDDTLTPDAVGVVAARLAADPELDGLYSDNDKELPGGPRFAPALKPDWSPEHLRACMYTLHLGVYRRSLVEHIGGFRPEFDGAQDHDLVLRLADAGARIGHVPSVLYHWGVHPGSAALGEHAKPEAYDAGRAAVDEHLRRTGVAGRATRLRYAGRFRVVHDVAPELAADLIVPLAARPSPGAAEVIAALAGDARPGVRVTVVPEADVEVPAGVAAHATIVPAVSGRWGDLAAAGLAATFAPVVVLFEDLCIPHSADWLDELAGLVGEPAIGAAGALVVDPEGKTVHAGVALPRGVPLPVHLDAEPDVENPAPELTMVTNRSAAAGVVAFDRDALARAGGVVRDLDRLALTATTLAVGAAGSRVVISPHARMQLAAARARAAVLDIGEITAVATRRRDQPDPFYNPGLWADRAGHVVPLSLQRRGFADLPAT